MRLKLFVAGVVVWSGVLVGRLVELQVGEHEAYSERAQRQQLRVVELEPPRGAIRDARGRELAVSVEVDSVYAVPREVDDSGTTAARLAPLLGLRRDELAERLELDREFVWVARKLDRPIADAVRAQELDGIYFLPESKRYYPLREVGAQILGFVGTDHEGLAGVEARYDEVVAGRAARRTVLRDARQGVFAGPGAPFVEPEPGADLFLTIDASVQFLVQRALAEARAEYGAETATAVLLDPETGAVLAMASDPGFDPNRFRSYPDARWRNLALSDAYEPGSTFKVFTISAALEHGLTDPDQVVDCEMGAIRLGGTVIRDHKPFGLLTVSQILARSSNVGAVKTGLLLGDERLYGAIRDFGFGELTGIDLPGESRGILRPVESWAPLSKAYISFGQEVSITPLQLARAVAAIANGGRLVSPHVVAAIDRGAGPVPVSPMPPRTILTEETARSLAIMMAGVVEEGTARRAAVPGYAVAGKTGTAQKSIDGRYSATRFVASFVGFAPLSRPAIVGVVTMDEPRGRYHGGEVAAPTFAQIAGPVLRYLGVRPDRAVDRPEPPSPAPVPEPPALLAREEPLAPGGTPRFLGLSPREAVALAERVGLDLRLDGHGRVIRQEPPAGSPIPSTPVVSLWLEVGA